MHPIKLPGTFRKRDTNSIKAKRSSVKGHFCNVSLFTVHQLFIELNYLLLHITLTRPRKVSGQLVSGTKWSLHTRASSYSAPPTANEGWSETLSCVFQSASHILLPSANNNLGHLMKTLVGLFVGSIKKQGNTPAQWEPVSRKITSCPPSELHDAAS